MKLYSLLAPLLLWGCAHVPTIHGRKQTVDYFFAPSCNNGGPNGTININVYCERANEIINKLESKFGDQIDLERHCGMSEVNPDFDEKECQRLYNQPAAGSSNMLEAWGGRGFPAIYVNKVPIWYSEHALCRALQLEKDCLDRTEL